MSIGMRIVIRTNAVTTKYNVTEIIFDFEGDFDIPLTLEEQVQITFDNLGVWEADDEDDLIEEITTASGWCLKTLITKSN